MRRFARLAAAVALTFAGLGAGALAPTPARADAGWDCIERGGLYVLGPQGEAGCATRGGSAYSAMQSLGWSLQDGSSGMLCAVNGFPGGTVCSAGWDSQQRYLKYWVYQDGSWSYATIGGRDTIPGGITMIGWVFGSSTPTNPGANPGYYPQSPAPKPTLPPPTQSPPPLTQPAPREPAPTAPGGTEPASTIPPLPNETSRVETSTPTGTAPASTTPAPSTSAATPSATTASPATSRPASATPRPGGEAPGADGSAPATPRPPVTPRKEGSPVGLIVTAVLLGTAAVVAAAYVLIRRRRP